MHPFRNAFKDRDEAAIQALLADYIVFTGPVAFTPFVGKPITAAILCSVLGVFEDFRYVREFQDRDAGLHALEFEAGVAGAPGVTVNGCDFFHVNDEGLIDDLKVMVRPLSGATALADAMGAQFGRIQLATLIADACGMTERERRVTELVAQGLSTTDIGQRLHLSAYTVQDHLKAIFDKTGTSTRGELVARLFFDHYAPRLQISQTY